jgi:hypothetical protein
MIDDDIGNRKRPKPQPIDTSGPLRISRRPIALALMGMGFMPFRMRFDPDGRKNQEHTGPWKPNWPITMWFIRTPELMAAYERVRWFGYLTNQIQLGNVEPTLEVLNTPIGTQINPEHDEPLREMEDNQ